MVTQADVKKWFDYHPDGYLIWRKRSGARGLVGKRAGTAVDRVDINSYYLIKFRGRQCGLHRVIFLCCNGWLPLEIDHIANNKTNNRIENLRAATHNENCWNQTTPKNNTSGCKGVSWDKSCGKWKAQISFRGKRINLGRFRSLNEAACRYDSAATELFGEFARPNGAQDGY